jgi:cob(I)alamin adenosyltransferase
MRHILDKEDRVLFKRDLKNLNKWIEDYIKNTKQPHPFVIVGQHKENLNGRSQSQNQ